MSYDQFSLVDIQTQFSLTIHQSKSLFEDVTPIEISDHLKITLKENIPLALNINTEKARSEMLIVPMLIELRKLLHRTVSLFSGVSLNVDENRGLTGLCDFLICNSPNHLYVNRPVIAIVEAKNENIKSAIPKCVAKMYAAQQSNQGDLHGNIMGIVSTGSSWKFLILAENSVFVDYDEYLIEIPEKILAVAVDHVRKVNS
ncbi:hypothetical protein QUF64_13210 [Anaerolineales bacterium HSG6]|nr:hypothetical protein [Anaerolineales bacterium HSG6]MDM8531042.1 hypothetical protein [Anaerolineales bacterium HSG25]